MDSFYTFWAAEGLLGFADGYSDNRNNFFIYLNPKTDRFHFLPWGADHLFTNSGFRPEDSPISVRTQGLIAHKLYQLESGRKRYAQTLVDILEDHWNEAELLAETERIQTMVKPHLVQSQRVFGDRDKRNGEPETFDDALSATREFIRQRRSEITLEIADGMPEWTQVPDEPFVMGPATMALFVIGGIIPYVNSYVKLIGGFNRVDGLRLGRRLDDIYQRKGGGVVGEVTYGFSNKRWNYRLGWEARDGVLRPLNLNLTAQVHRVTTVRDADVLPNNTEQLWSLNLSQCVAAFWQNNM